MKKLVTKPKKEATFFNFEHYKNLATEIQRKITTQIDEQIKTLTELSAQVNTIINDEKVFVFHETPSQKRQRLFGGVQCGQKCGGHNNKYSASSPLKEMSKKLGFCAVITPNTKKIEHFRDCALENTFEMPSISLPVKRRMSNSKINQISTNKDKSYRNNVLRNLTNHNVRTSTPRYNSGYNTCAKIKKLHDDKFDKSKDISNSSNISNNLDQKEKRRLKMLEVEQRRKALEEERLKKLAQKDNKVKNEKSRQIPLLLTPKPKILNESQTKSAKLQKPQLNSKISSQMSAKIAPQTSVKGEKIDKSDNYHAIKIDYNNRQTSDNNYNEIPEDPQSATKSTVKIPHNPKRETFDFKTPNNIPIKTNYNITPEYTVKKPVAPPIKDEYTSYDINDLHSDDNSDDEDEPMKPIPEWAQDKCLWLAIISQNKDVPIKGEQVFGPIPDFTTFNFFTQPSLRYRNRTSSALWDPSILEPII